MIEPAARGSRTHTHTHTASIPMAMQAPFACFQAKRSKALLAEDPTLAPQALNAKLESEWAGMSWDDRAPYRSQVLMSRSAKEVVASSADPEMPSGWLKDVVKGSAAINPSLPGPLRYESRVLWHGEVYRFGFKVTEKKQNSMARDGRFRCPWCMKSFKTRAALRTHTGLWTAEVWRCPNK